MPQTISYIGAVCSGRRIQSGTHGLYQSLTIATGIISLAMKMNPIVASLSIVVSTLEQARAVVDEQMRKAG
jgi:hypothetical protein